MCLSGTEKYLDVTFTSENMFNLLIYSLSKVLLKQIRVDEIHVCVAHMEEVRIWGGGAKG
jgi:hypothetical protein